MVRFATLASLAAAGLLAGCGSSSSNNSSGASSVAGVSSSAGAQSRVTLSEAEFKITPASVGVVHLGTITITVKNDGAVTHALAVQTPSGVVKTGSIDPGGTATLTVNATKAGSYTFYCPIPGHRQAGMQGTLVVGGAGGGGAGSATTSSAAKPAVGY